MVSQAPILHLTNWKFKSVSWLILQKRKESLPVHHQDCTVRCPSPWTIPSLILLSWLVEAEPTHSTSIHLPLSSVFAPCSWWRPSSSHQFDIWGEEIKVRKQVEISAPSYSSGGQAVVNTPRSLKDSPHLKIFNIKRNGSGAGFPAFSRLSSAVTVTGGVMPIRLMQP